MYPVLSDLYEQGRTNAIEAIFLYPLNALMEDQKKRLNEYCEATGLHFAVYNGDTPEYHADGRNETLSNEIPTRAQIREQSTRPEILLTNPSMLEYILVRQKDQDMLKESAGKLRWIIIDEAHHAISDGYQRVLKHFEKSKVLGVTATPYRGDMKNLGQYFESLAYEYTLPKAIKEGYLTPIKALTIPLKLDISNVKVTSGDFSSGEIGSALEPYLDQIAYEMTHNKQNTYMPSNNPGYSYSQSTGGYGPSSSQGGSVLRQQLQLLRTPQPLYRPPG